MVLSFLFPLFNILKLLFPTLKFFGNTRIFISAQGGCHDLRLFSSDVAGGEHPVLGLPDFDSVPVRCGHPRQVHSQVLVYPLLSLRGAPDLYAQDRWPGFKHPEASEVALYLHKFGPASLKSVRVSIGEGAVVWGLGFKEIKCLLGCFLCPVFLRDQGVRSR